MVLDLAEKNKWIAVLGGGRQYDEEQIRTAYVAGRELARRGKGVATGGNTGIPYAAAIGAREGGSLVVGISPASNIEEHIARYKMPIDFTDLTVYTGMGFSARSSVLVNSVCGMIFIGGEMGTLNEFTAAWMCGNNVLGVLSGTGGISDSLKSLLSEIQTEWGSVVIQEVDPVKLVHKVCEEIDKMNEKRFAKLSYGTVGQDVKDIIEKFKQGENNGGR
jgi:uncharacterized protein (TIGR00725 family)